MNNYKVFLFKQLSTHESMNKPIITETPIINIMYKWCPKFPNIP